MYSHVYFHTLKDSASYQCTCWYTRPALLPVHLPADQPTHQTEDEKKGSILKMIFLWFDVGSWFKQTMMTYTCGIAHKHKQKSSCRNEMQHNLEIAEKKGVFKAVHLNYCVYHTQIHNQPIKTSVCCDIPQ